MNNINTILVAAGALTLASCGKSANGQSAETESNNAESASSPMRVLPVPEFEAVSGTYETDSEHAYITFHYDHQGYSRPYLRWRDWTGTLEWDAENPANSTIEVVIDAESIDSGVDRFDGHLRGDTFFDVANHPEITFVSTAVEATGGDTGKITGDLTIKGVTKPITLDVKYNKSAFNSRDNAYKIGFSATGVVNRSDYGVDTYAPAVSDKVKLVIETEFEMAADDAE